MYNTKEDKLNVLEEQFHIKVNKVISERITPLWPVLRSNFFRYSVSEIFDLLTQSQSIGI